MSNSVFRQIAGAFDTFREARDAANTYERLNRLSDRGLAARGLTRGDLPAYAFRAAQRR